MQAVSLGVVAGAGSVPVPGSRVRPSGPSATDFESLLGSGAAQGPAAGDAPAVPASSAGTAGTNGPGSPSRRPSVSGQPGGTRAPGRPATADQSAAPASSSSAAGPSSAAVLTAPAAPAEAAACAAQPPGENGQSAGAAAFDPTAQAAPAPDALPVAPPLPGANVAVRTRPKAVTSGDAGGDTQAQDESAVPAAAAHAALLTSDAASVLAGQLVQSPVPVPPVGDPASSTGTTPASGQAPGSPVDPVVRQADLAASPWATSRAALRGQGPAAMLTQVDAAGATAVPANLATPTDQSEPATPDPLASSARPAASAADATPPVHSPFRPTGRSSSRCSPPGRQPG